MDLEEQPYICLYQKATKCSGFFSECSPCNGIASSENQFLLFFAAHGRMHAESADVILIDCVSKHIAISGSTP